MKSKRLLSTFTPINKYCIFLCCWVLVSTYLGAVWYFALWESLGRKGIVKKLSHDYGFSSPLIPTHHQQKLNRSKYTHIDVGAFSNLILRSPKEEEKSWNLQICWQSAIDRGHMGFVLIRFDFAATFAFCPSSVPSMALMALVCRILISPFWMKAHPKLVSRPFFAWQFILCVHVCFNLSAAFSPPEYTCFVLTDEELGFAFLFH